MIELIYSDLCNGCGQCVAVCPTNVLAADTAGKPLIADQHACQTCFMCELYCSSDALYVDPDVEHLRHPDPVAVREAGLLGQYRRGTNGPMILPIATSTGAWMASSRSPAPHQQMQLANNQSTHNELF